MRSVFLFLLLGCAGPAAHEHPASGAAIDPATLPAPRAAVATTLTAADALAASDCALPSAPFVACPEPVEASPMEHHHHEPPAPARESVPLPITATPSPTPKVSAPKPVVASKVRDPICGMMIDSAKAPERVTRGGVTTFFCSATCKRAFLARAADGGTP